MRSLRSLALLPLISLAACRGPSLEARTFDLRYLDPIEAEQMVRPFVYDDRPGAPGQLSATRNAISVRETHDNLEHIARVIAAHDRPPANVRLTFQIIRADGSTAPDPAIAPVEAQLRQLFRFRGYQLVATGMTTGAAGAPILLRLEGADGPYQLRGELERTQVVGDSGVVRLAIHLTRDGRDVLTTRISIGIGQTVVLGGQPGGERGAIILAVRPDVVR